jgi:hypothetical protein
MSALLVGERKACLAWVTVIVIVVTLSEGLLPTAGDVSQLGDPPG